MPGVIDQDYSGEIKIMVYSPQLISTVQSGQRIAQLLLIPHTKAGQVKNNQSRGTQSFGSSDAYWVQSISQKRPELILSINGKKFKGLLDTGADVSCIASRHWPDSWPRQDTVTQLQGIGAMQSPQRSSNYLNWEDEEGHKGVFQPYIVEGLPVNLWGRDIMSKMGVYLYSPSTQVSQQMFDQGLLPDQGLGKTNEGRVLPITAQPRPEKAGLGYF